MCGSRGRPGKNSGKKSSRILPGVGNDRAMVNLKQNELGNLPIYIIHPNVGYCGRPSISI